jgi:DNA-binding NtrC family response regulator
MGVTHFVGMSPWARLLRENISRAAAFPSSVLITGPSGTGKELIARAVHEHSARRDGPFVPVDCTSLTGELFASHLFGHVKGAFTGAEHPRLGCFRAAEGGTIFLDEIGELSLELQSKLLRTLQERAVVPVGSDQPTGVDVRIIAATNRDLPKEVEAGRFRLDLYYRLNVVSFETILLAERPEDIEPLAEHILERLMREQGFPRKRLSAEAVTALLRRPWPGNVRELQNVLERAAVFATGEEIGSAAISEGNFQTATAASSPVSIEEADLPDLPGTAVEAATWPTLSEVQRAHITATLDHVFYNQSMAAKLLNINRASLARKISRYEISIPLTRRGRPRKTDICPTELPR